MIDNSCTAPSWPASLLQPWPKMVAGG